MIIVLASEGCGLDKQSWSKGSNKPGEEKKEDQLGGYGLLEVSDVERIEALLRVKQI